MEKLSSSVEQLRINQNTIARERVASYSATDINAAAPEYRRTVSSFGLNIYGGSRIRSSSAQQHRSSFSFNEPRIESWKMPLSFKSVGTFRYIFRKNSSHLSNNGIFSLQVSLIGVL